VKKSLNPRKELRKVKDPFKLSLSFQAHQIGGIFQGEGITPSFPEKIIKLE